LTDQDRREERGPFGQLQHRGGKKGGTVLLWCIVKGKRSELPREQKTGKEGRWHYREVFVWEEKKDTVTLRKKREGGETMPNWGERVGGCTTDPT